MQKLASPVTEVMNPYKETNLHYNVQYTISQCFGPNVLGSAQLVC